MHYGGERVVIGRAGKASAALISMRDLGLLELLIEEAEDRIDVAEADRIAADEPQSVPWEEVRRGLDGASAVHIEIKSSAVRTLRRLPAPVRAKVVSVIDALVDDPRPPGCKKLAGQVDRYRVRAAGA